MAIDSLLPLMDSNPECDIDCESEAEEEPVCGNDGRTYDSRCEIDKAKCQGHPVEFKHNGKCVEKARCEAQRTLMLEQGKQFVPECEPDGSYSEVQCHRSAGYCWCVDEAGRPVRGSSIQNTRPNCARHSGRRTNRRRSSRGGKKTKKDISGCGTTDRARFNENLIDIFHSEYDRVPHSTETTVQSSRSTDTPNERHTHNLEKRKSQWKFDN
ncbi:hypothetical protein JTE90_012518 [Oedothorax gibbosus]|uniref:Uncharacterized protein n=1 Tax=Oedothorax gibbosus TaxID=931172 RepID=A0AAV6V0R9_9ARAC|nr:hypothetical protein JTE90_012518 [Oedothorax gibbosus]